MQSRKIVTALFLLLLTTGFVVAQGGQAVDVPALDGFSRSSAGGVDVQWRVDGETLEVQMAANTTGWVSVGFDPSRMMADANIIIGYVEDGEVVIADDYGTGATKHDRDTNHGGTNDVTVVEGREVDGTTIIRFTIPLDSGDEMDKALETGTTYTALASHGPDGANDFTTYHADRGSFQLEL